MSRGKQLKTKVKEAITVGSTVQAAIELGKEKAKRKLEKSDMTLEGLMKFFSHKIGDIEVKDTVEIGLYAGLAYIGYDLFKDWKGALLGPVCLKLATSSSEAAAIAGIAGLATLGVLEIAIPDVGGAVGKVIHDVNSAARERAYVLEQTANGVYGYAECVERLADSDPLFRSYACAYAEQTWLRKSQPTGEPPAKAWARGRIPVM